MIFFEKVAGIFLGFHGLLSMITVIALFFCAGYVVLRKEPEWRVGRILGLISSSGYILTFVLGLLIYPVFRVKVRVYDFDLMRPWATGIFEIKEHLSSLGLLAAIGILVIAISLKLEESSLPTKKLYASLVSATFLITAAVAVLGLILVVIHPI